MAVDAELRELLRRWTHQRLEAGEHHVHRSAPAAKASAVNVTAAAKAANVTAPAKAAPVTAPAAGPASLFAAAPAPVAAAVAAPALSPVVPGDSMARVAEEVRACTRCRLHATRNKAVPGVGPDDAGLVFVGEGPGGEEDIQGEPFVGAAGQLLNKILAAVGLRRDQVFITNIVKCRPPGNRDPQPDEVAACEPFLKRQLALLQPHVICALGRHAGSWLNGKPESMASLRSGERRYAGIRVFPTYHPAALLRNPQWKRPVWEDIQKVRAEYDRLRGES